MHHSVSLLVLLALLPSVPISAAPPKIGADQVVSTVLFGSCVKQAQPMPILAEAAAQNADLFLWMGDNIYGDSDDMQVLRQKYGVLGSNRDFLKLRAATPFMATWDDHDYGRNDAGADFEHRDAAEAEFHRFWRTPAEAIHRQRPGVYHSRIFGPAGKRLQIIMLDTRYFRSALKKGERRVGGPYYPDDAKSKTMLGDAQWTWLEKQLNQPAELRLIVTSIQCLAEAAGQETWSNLPRERQRLFRLIQSTRANGVLMVSGDRHWSEISQVDVGYPLIETTSSSLNQRHGRGTPTANRHRSSKTTFHLENYGAMLIDWQGEATTVTLEIRDIKSEVKLRRKVSLSDLQWKSEP